MIGGRLIRNRLATETLANGTLGAHVHDAVAALLSGKTAPVWSGPGITIPPPDNEGQVVNASTKLCDLFNDAVTARNTNWLGAVDQTCIPTTFSSPNGVLIAPDIMLHSTHNGPSVGNQLSFIDNNGNVYTRTCRGTSQISDSIATDILVTMWDPLPASITPCTVLDKDTAEKIPRPSMGYVAIQHNQDARLIPYTVTGVGPVGSTTTGATVFGRTSVEFPAWAYSIRGQDSGSPIFLLVNGKLCLLGNVSVAFFYGNYIDKINAAIASMGSTSKVTITDTSMFPRI